jgi:molecular chaperone DnaK
MARSYGIDLGTSRTKISCFDTDFGEPKVIEIDAQPLVPSVVWFDEGDSARPIKVGWQADSQKTNHPNRVISSVKLQMGKSAPELALSGKGDPRLPLQFAGKSYGPTEISAEILRYVVQSTHSKSYAPREVVVTVPAEFDFRQREATVAAIEAAGLKLQMLLSEPVAALLAELGSETFANSRTLVFDLGGGTLDCTVIEIAHGENQVRSKTGGMGIAGDYIDSLLYNYLIKDLDIPTNRQYDPDIHNEAQSKLKERCRVVKENLSARDTTEQPFFFTNIQLKGKTFDFDRMVSRVELERLIAPLIGIYQSNINEAISKAGLAPSQIDRVLVVGGSTRIPLIRETLVRMFGDKTRLSKDPDLAVSLGAAIAANSLSQGQPVIFDTLTRNLGKQSATSFAFNLLLQSGTSLKEAHASDNATWPAGASSVAVNLFEAADGAKTINDTNANGPLCTYVGTYELTPKSVPQNSAPFDVDYKCNPQTTLLEVSARFKGGGPAFAVTRHNTPIGAQSVEAKQQARLDLMVLLDTTGSMRHGDWNGLKTDLRETILRLWDSPDARSGQLNMRAALTTFGDSRASGLSQGDPMQILPFTPRQREFCDRYLGRLDEFATEGGDDPESCFDALWRAANAGLRADDKTLRAFVLITNGSESAPPTGNLSPGDITRELLNRDIVVYSISPYCAEFAELAESTGGLHREFDDGPMREHLRVVLHAIAQKLNGMAA